MIRQDIIIFGVLRFLGEHLSNRFQRLSSPDVSPSDSDGNDDEKAFLYKMSNLTVTKMLMKNGLWRMVVTTMYITND